MHDKPEPGDHLYDDAPVAVSVTLLPAQKVVSGPAVTTGDGRTTIVNACVLNPFSGQALSLNVT